MTSSDSLRERFDAAPAYAVGIEDELMLLDPQTLGLVPKASSLLALAGGDGRFKLELPASQVEIVTPPRVTVGEAAADLLEGRRALALAADGMVRLAAAGAHPFSSGHGALNEGDRYDRIVREYGCVAARQLVCALQVHVSVGDADRALAVYNAARSYLPHLAALAANAPFYEGVDTGLASVRPKIAELLPRQGVPPVINSWSEFAHALDWGARTGAFTDPGGWWWELRPHPTFGTLEFRVPDGQSTVADAAAIAAVIQALVAALGARHDAGEELAIEPSWKIDENRWSACRDGIEGELADLQTGRRLRTRACLETMLEMLEPSASSLGSDGELALARRLVAVNGALEQRRVARGGGPRAVALWLAERFLLSADG